MTSSGSPFVSTVRTWLRGCFERKSSISLMHQRDSRSSGEQITIRKSEFVRAWSMLSPRSIVMGSSSLSRKMRSNRRIPEDFRIAAGMWKRSSSRWILPAMRLSTRPADDPAVDVTGG